MIKQVKRNILESPD